MKVHVLFFAQARERVGRARVTLELPDGSHVADALERIEHAHPAIAELMPHLAVAVNQKLARPADLLPPDSEVALLPPVSGGAGVRGARKGTAIRGFRALPATRERWEDVERLFGPRGACAGCWCQWPRLRGKAFGDGRGAGNRERLRRRVSRGPAPGLIGYLGDQPVAWLALGPRREYDRIEHSRTLARLDDQEVWSVPCFFVARSARGRGLTVRMLRAAIAHARASGAAVLEGYPVEPGRRAADAFVWWGLVGAFRAAGFTEVARRSPTHPVMRKRLRGRGPLVTPGTAASHEPGPGGRPARQPRTGRKTGG